MKERVILSAILALVIGAALASCLNGCGGGSSESPAQSPGVSPPPVSGPPVAITAHSWSGQMTRTLNPGGAQPLLTISVSFAPSTGIVSGSIASVPEPYRLTHLQGGISGALYLDVSGTSDLSGLNERIYGQLTLVSGHLVGDVRDTIYAPGNPQTNGPYQVDLQ